MGFTLDGWDASGLGAAADPPLGGSCFSIEGCVGGFFCSGPCRSELWGLLSYIFILALMPCSEATGFSVSMLAFTGCWLLPECCSAMACEVSWTCWGGKVLAGWCDEVLAGCWTATDVLRSLFAAAGCSMVSVDFFSFGCSTGALPCF